MLHGPGPLGHQHVVAPDDEHYHVIYHVPRENLAIPYFKEVFTTAREAYLKIHALGEQAEPNTEWYEDGEVGFETRLPGRMGVFWVVVEVSGCIRRSCAQFMTKDQKKRRLTFVPDDGEPVVREINPAAVEVLREHEHDGAD